MKRLVVRREPFDAIEEAVENGLARTLNRVWKYRDPTGDWSRDIQAFIDDAQQNIMSAIHEEVGYESEDDS